MILLIKKVKAITPKHYGRRVSQEGDVETDDVV